MLPTTFWQNFTGQKTVAKYSTWREIAGNWTLLPAGEPVAIVHFLGGAGVAAAPHLTYRWLLERLGDRGYIVVATAIAQGSFDHGSLASQSLERLETVLDSLDRRGWLDAADPLPVFGLGHSMGCKLHLLIGSLYEVQRGGNILISFNNFSAQRAIPLFEQFAPRLISVDRSARQWIDVLGSALGDLADDLTGGRFERDRLIPRIEDWLPPAEGEFSPSPAETERLIARQYGVARNLVLKFRDDRLDQSLRLGEILADRFPDDFALYRLGGNHLTPLGQVIGGEAADLGGAIGTALGSAIGTAVNQAINQLPDRVYGDLYRLEERIQAQLATWLEE